MENKDFSRRSFLKTVGLAGAGLAVGTTFDNIQAAANTAERYIHKTTDNRQTLPRFQPEAMRANTRIVTVLQDFGRTRGMTSAQVALGWLLQKEPWIVPIPGTTKLSHLEENLHTFDFTVSRKEWLELEKAVASIPVTGDRYNAEQQRQVGL